MEQPGCCNDPAARMDCADTAKSALRVLEGKWKLVIINELMAGEGHPLRFSELERAVNGVSQKVLIQQLKELQADGIVLRTLYPQVPPKVEYSLTDLGLKLEPAIRALVAWDRNR